MIIGREIKIKIKISKTKMKKFFKKPQNLGFVLGIIIPYIYLSAYVGVIVKVISNIFAGILFAPIGPLTVALMGLRLHFSLENVLYFLVVFLPVNILYGLLGVCIFYTVKKIRKRYAN